MRLRNAVYLFVLSLFIMSCAHNFAPTQGISRNTEIDPHYGYVYGSFTAMGLSQLEGGGKLSGWALEVEAVGKNKSVSGSIFIPFEFETNTDFSFNRTLNNEINGNRDQKAISPSGNIRVIKIPPGRYKFKNVVYAQYSREVPDQYKIKGKTKIGGHHIPETIKIKSGTFYYIGSWRTKEALNYMIGMEQWNHTVYDFFKDETFYFLNQYPKARKCKKYNVFTSTAYKYPVEIVAALFSDYENIQKAAESMLNEVGKPAVMPLIGLYRRADWRKRVRILDLLEKIGEPAVEPLIQVLQTGDQSARWCAVEALGDIGDIRAVEALIAALQDDDASVRETVEGALQKMTQQDFGSDYQKWAEWWKKNKKNFYIDNN